MENMARDMQIRNSNSGDTREQTVKNTRLNQLKPVVLREIERNFGDEEYFTRDHLLYFQCMRQFSMSYRIGLIREIVRAYVKSGKLLRYNISDFGINNPSNARKLRTMQRNHEVAYSGSYTTRAADELLIKDVPLKPFDSRWLAAWLDCLDHLAESTKNYYAKRIIDDLVRRGVLKEHPGFIYTVNKLATN
jgi:hypothetical protein